MQTNPKTVKPKRSISTASGPYDLWNSLTSEEENTVVTKLSLEKGGLPLTKKDAETQRLLFGEGNFGKVKLAHKEGEFYGVKGITLHAGDDVQDIMREYHFGKMLESVPIPNVIYAKDVSAPTTNKRGQNKLYLFLNKVASLGDGRNLKRLLSYFDSPEQREAVLLHSAYSIIQTVAIMHNHHIYHRDLKAANILVSATGQVYVSDFGAATTHNPNIIANVLNAQTPEYAVSSVTDTRYYSPEIRSAVVFQKGAPTNSNEILDNWRLGLTLLQLCGVIKENEGILTRTHDAQNEDGNIIPGWHDEILRKSVSITQESLNNYYEEQIQKIKTESLDKIPVQLRDIIFGLLEIDHKKRLSANDALHKLQQQEAPDEKIVQAGFKNLVHNQISETLKNSVKKALKAEAVRTNSAWQNDAIKEFRLLLKQKNTSFEFLESFLDKWIPDEVNQPTITKEQFQVTLSLVHKKAGISAIEPTSPPIEPIIPATEVEDREFDRLHRNLKTAANQLLEYAKQKVSKRGHAFKELEEQTIKSLNSMVGRIKQFLTPKPLEFERTEKLKGGQFDESAVKAVFARTNQIMSQLTVGKLMTLNSQELTAVYRMLEKDKDFLESIEDKVPQNFAVTNPLKQINIKMQLIEQLRDSNYLYISTKKLDSDQFLDHKYHAIDYRANHRDTDTHYTFSKSKNITAYHLPPTPNELFSNFVMMMQDNTLQDKELYLYTTSRKLAETIAHMLTSLKKNPNQKIYVNDQLVTKKSAAGARFDDFFRKGRIAQISEQIEKFSIEEISSLDIKTPKK